MDYLKEFDESRIYTAVNADKLHAGDLVVCADDMNTLRKLFATHEVKELRDIFDEDEVYRFEVKPRDEYALAYLLCTADDPCKDIKLAYYEGKQIQYQWSDGHWEDIACPSFESSPDHYRVKPEKPEGSEGSEGTLYRPFNSVQELIDIYVKLSRVTCSSDMSFPQIWLKSKLTHVALLITKLDFNVPIGHVWLSDGKYSLPELLEYFTFLDGTPCGVQESTSDD